MKAAKRKLKPNQFINYGRIITVKEGDYYPRVLLKGPEGNFWKVVKQSHDYYYLRQVLSCRVMQLRIKKTSAQGKAPSYKVVAKIKSRKEIWQVLEGKRIGVKAKIFR